MDQSLRGNRLLTRAAQTASVFDGVGPSNASFGRSALRPPVSDQHFVDYVTMHIGQPEIPSAEAVGQLFVVDSEQVQHRRV